MRHLRQHIIISIILSVLLLNGCSKGTNPEGSTAIPTVSVNVTGNINSSPYTPLLTVGGVVYINGGYRGILLYRSTSTAIMAFDRACTYDLSNPNGIVTAQSSGATGLCIDCGSTYSLLNGDLLSGPSTMGIQSYPTTFNTSTGLFTVKN
ncbi:MAG TPA: hypothetical protein VK783_14540 [Bacteroidia bacterium]|jgi:hypothetical protein|nr:hypothetical protein [Bacteroidia bacterium]